MKVIEVHHKMRTVEIFEDELYPYYEAYPVETANEDEAGLGVGVFELTEEFYWELNTTMEKFRRLQQELRRLVEEKTND